MRINKLVAAVFCFAVLAIPQLVLNQKSVAFDALGWVAAMVLAGSFLGVFVSRSAHLYLLLAVLFWVIFGVGLAEAGAVIFWLISAWSLGVLILRKLYANAPNSHTSATEAILLGATIWLAVSGGMLHFAINYRELYIVLCLLPCLLLASRYSMICADLRCRAVMAQDWMRSIPLWVWGAGLTIIGWVLRWASFPTMGYDDHALHLRIWTELLTQQRYAFDVHAQIWSVAPFVVDLLHAGLSLMAGHDARSAMNLGLAILLLLLMARILHNWKLAVRAQWLLMVLMASTPMLGNLLLSQNVELMLAVVALAGMRLVIDADGGWRGQHVLGVFACAALCAGIKLPGAVLGVTLLVALAVRWWSQRATPRRIEHRLRWPALLMLIPLSFVALHSYVLAWKVTGNPVFPLYNAIFLSPLFSPVNFSHTRWIHGFNLSSYLRAFFYTSDFFESYNYTAGWQYLFLLPIAIVMLFRQGIPNGLRITLLPVFGFGLAMFSATQYWRYLFPIMPIAGILFAALFIGKNRSYQVVIIMITLACIVFNIRFFTNVSWMMHSPSSAAYTRDGKMNLVRRIAAAAFLTEKINQLAPGSRVLYPPGIPYGATLHGSPLYVNWYSPSREARFASLKNAQDIAEFLAQEKVDFVLLRITEQIISFAPEILLREHVARFGSAIAQEGHFSLYRLSEIPALYRKIFDLGASIKKTPEEAELLLPFSEAGVLASTELKRLAVLQTHRAKQARYSVVFSCPSEDGFFVAQINWDKGERLYYRLVACKPESVSFTEVIPIPVGANTGTLSVAARDTTSVQIRSLLVEIN